MVKSDYSYNITNYQGHGIIVIEDQNKGRKSVTNDIENVVEEIGDKENIRLRDFIIVYRDSEGFWDGYDYIKESFILIREHTWKAAAGKYLQIKKKV